MPSAAVSMSWATSPRWETIATWLEGISMVVAPCGRRTAVQHQAASAPVRLSAVCYWFPLNTCVPGGEYPGESGAGHAGGHAEPQHKRVAGLGGQGLSRGGVTGQNRRGHGAAEGIA